MSVEGQGQSSDRLARGRDDGQRDLAAQHLLAIWRPPPALSHRPTDVGLWDRVDKGIAEADISPIMGFTFDRKPVENEIAQVNTVAKEYGNLNRGMVEDTDATLAEYKSKLQEAGIDKIIAEAQRQIDAWTKTLPAQ